MGLIMSTVKYMFGAGEDLDVPDATTGLTKREKMAITSSWDLVKVNLKENGVELFIGYFNAYPKNQDFFETFKGKEPESLRKSAKLRVHGTTVMHALNSFVENLDDPECLVGLLEKNAASHYKRGIRMQHYNELFEGFVKFMQKVTGGKIDKFTQESWEKALKVMSSVIETELTKQSNIKA